MKRLLGLAATAAVLAIGGQVIAQEVATLEYEGVNAAACDLAPETQDVLMTITTAVGGGNTIDIDEADVDVFCNAQFTLEIEPFEASAENLSAPAGFADSFTGTPTASALDVSGGTNPPTNTTITISVAPDVPADPLVADTYSEALSVTLTTI